MATAGGSSRQVLAYPTFGQFRESTPASRPMAQHDAAQSSPDPFVQRPKHAGRLAEPEVAPPATQVLAQRQYDLTQALSLVPVGEFPHLGFEAFDSLGRDTPFGLLSAGEAEGEELAVLRAGHRAFRLVDLELESAGNELADAFHHPLAGTFGANIDVAIIRVSHELGPALLKLL